MQGRKDFLGFLEIDLLVIWLTKDIIQVLQVTTFESLLLRLKIKFQWYFVPGAEAVYLGTLALRRTEMKALHPQSNTCV